MQDETFWHAEVELHILRNTRWRYGIADRRYWGRGPTANACARNDSVTQNVLHPVTWLVCRRSLSRLATVGRFPLISDGVTGSSSFRFVGESRRNGVKCLLIEGETSYEMVPEDPNQEAIVSVRFGPRTSTYCFDAERGRLIEGNELIPTEMTSVDGDTHSTTVRVRRELIEQPKEPKLWEVTRRIADGKVLKFWYRGGSPVNSQVEWADITGSGIMLGLAQQDDGLIKAEKLVWIWLC